MTTFRNSASKNLKNLPFSIHEKIFLSTPPRVLALASPRPDKAGLCQNLSHSELPRASESLGVACSATGSTNGVKCQMELKYWVFKLYLVCPRLL